MTHVIAVEDSPTQAETLRADLEGAGFQVTLARDGVEALDLLAALPVDMVLSDVVMPDMDGYELCAAIKSDPATRHLPVVLLTSLTDPLDVVHGLEAGADNFIRKPYQSEQLLARLMTTLHNRELRSTGRMQMGIELSFLDRQFTITAERQQILDLLISTFEELVISSREVRQREEELARAHRKVAEQLQLAEVERSRLQAVLDAVPLAVVVSDVDGLVSHVSNVAADLFEMPVDDLIGRPSTEVATFVDVEGIPLEADANSLAYAVAEGRSAVRGTSFDVFLQRSDGSRVPVLLHASPFYDAAGVPAGSVGAAQVLGRLALSDPLTGLPGNTAFATQVDTTMAAGGQGAVLLLAVEGLDLARVASGAATGDELVAVAARRLRRAAAARPGQTHFLAYLGGGQFGVVAEETDALEIYRLAETLRVAIEDLQIEDCDDFALTASVGVSLGGVSTEPGQMLAAAGAALRRAREAGGNRVEMFDRAASQEALDRLQLEVDLRQAVERGELLLHYQPQVDLRSGRLIGFEALARWQHETRGYVPPDVFIAIAEESGLIRSLGSHLLTTACRQVKEWQDRGLGENFEMAVNLSAHQLRPQLVDEVGAALAASGIRPQRLVLEITETAAMADPEGTYAVLEQLRALGVKFALDDFGTGYSSLAYLNRIRFDQVKLDRTFVAGLFDGGADAAIAQSVIALGHALGVQVLAEGVENAEQGQRLLEMGCDLAQGYHFARPLTPLAAAEFVAGRDRDVAPL